MKRFLRLIYPIVTLIIGGVVGGLVLKCYGDLPRTIQYLDYEVESSRPLPGDLVIPGKKIVTTIDGRTVDQLTRLDLFVYNYSCNDFENVRFYIDIVPTNSASLMSGLVLGDWPADGEGIPEAVRSLSNLKPPDHGEARFGYDIHTLNRSDLLRPSFKVSYFLLGDERPSLRVRVDKAGLKLRRLAAETIPRPRNWWWRWLTRSRLFLAIAAFVLGIMAPRVLSRLKKT